MDTSYIGKPIHYAHGPNAGKTIRTELSEYQKPDLGRKFAKRDRRPLDPPPVVRVRLWEVFDAGLPTQSERELAAEDVEVQGLVAHVDLFRANTDGTIQQGDPSETASLTKHCFGSSFVHATHILDLTGQPAIIFVFADLSVRLEGVFALRYRIFDLVSRVDGSNAIPVAAELYGGVFTVYSTKEFPGLQASTPLTKHLSRWGVRVNLREGERKRKAGLDDDDDDDELDAVGGAGDEEEGAGGDPTESAGAAGSSSSKKGGKSGKGGAKTGASGSKGAKAKVARTGAEGTTSISHQATTTSFGDFQSPHQTNLAGPSTRQQQPESVLQAAGSSVTPTPPPPRSGLEDQREANQQQPPPQWVGAGVSWSRPPTTTTTTTTTSGGDWSRSPVVSADPSAASLHQSATVGADWTQRPSNQQQQPQQQLSTDPSHPTPQQAKAGGVRSRKRARPNPPQPFDSAAAASDTPPGLSQPSPEDVANLSISNNGRMMSSYIAASQQQQTQSPNYAQVLAAASYGNTPPSQPPPLVPAQRTSSFGPPQGGFATVQSPNTVSMPGGGGGGHHHHHLAAQSPIGMHSPASFAIPSSATQFAGYRGGR